jgi:membrane fusion protein
MTISLFRSETTSAVWSDFGFPLGVSSWWTRLYVFFLVLALIAACFSVIFGSYSRKILVSGFVVPDKGLIKIDPPRSGQIDQVLVAEGQHVSKDQPLFVMDVSNVTGLGKTGDLLEVNLGSQHDLLRDELVHLSGLQNSERDHLDASIASLNEQIRDTQEELSSRQSFLHLAQAQLHRLQTLEITGAVSLTARDQAEQAEVDARTQIATLQTQLGTTQGQLLQSEADRRGLPDKQANDRSEIKRQITQIEQQLLQLEEQRALVIRASEAGTVTRITAHVGTNVDAVTTPIVPLLTIVPDDSVLQANLYVPSNAIGFAKTGGNILLRYEAYPYEKFGLQEAAIAEISRTSVNARELPFPTTGDDPYYLVVAKLAKSTVTAFGREEPVEPGMKFQADMILESRHLWEWAIEPVIAAGHSL